MKPVMIHADGTGCAHEGTPRATVQEDGSPRCPAGIPVTGIRMDGRDLTVEEAAPADAYAVITPAGELTWYPLARAADVEAMVGGTVAPGALDTVTVVAARIPGRGPLKVLASDIALLFPDEYAPNPVAGAVLEALSAGRLSQPWRGCVALTEYAADPVTGEVLWPGEMSPRWADLVNAAVRRARDDLKLAGGT